MVRGVGSGLRADIFLGILIECSFTASGAEIIGLALVFGLAGRGLGVNGHSAHDIFFHLIILLCDKVILMARLAIALRTENLTERLADKNFAILDQ
jgi:hypothetical protein